MQNTAQFLDALRAKLDLPSDGRLADHLGMHRQHISRYRTLGHTFDDETSMTIADILEIDPAYIIACMHHQRAKEPKVKAVLERMAVAMTAIAAVLVAVVGLPDQMQGFEYVGLVGSLATSAFNNNGDFLYIMRILFVIFGVAFLLYRARPRNPV